MQSVAGSRPKSLGGQGRPQTMGGRGLPAEGGDRYMRFRRRYVIAAVASVTALAVSGIAYADHGPGGNTGVKCTATVTNCQDNTSALPTWMVRTPANSNNLPGAGGGGNGGSGVLGNVKLDIQTASFYAHPNQPVQGGKIANVALLFDNDVAVNLAGIPSCVNHGFTSSTTIAQAWERCGPGADGPGEVNAYLSPPGAVSGTISTSPPSNFPGCNLVFKQSATQILLFAKATFVPNGTANCSNPATNNTGNTTVLLTGTLSTQTPAIADYKTKLNVPVPVSVPLALDNFKSTINRAAAFQGRCRDTNKLMNLRGTFTYSDSQTEQPPDTVVKTFPCT